MSNTENTEEFKLTIKTFRLFNENQKSSPTGLNIK